MNEGIAEYVATGERGDSTLAAQILGQVGHQEELLQLGNLPASGIPRWQSYHAALSFFLFLHHQYGEEKVQAMIRQFTRVPATIEDIVLLIYGKTLLELEKEWQLTAKSAASLPR